MAAADRGCKSLIYEPLLICMRRYARCRAWLEKTGSAMVTEARHRLHPWIAGPPTGFALDE
jgi:hypothetical protein